MDPLYQVPTSIDRDRRRLGYLFVGIVLILVTIYYTWPSTVEDASGDNVYAGEVWGDLTTGGEIWGEHVSELDNVSLYHWGMGDTGGLRVNVTNVSNIWLVDYSQGTNITVPCENGSFQIIADNGGFGAHLSNLAFECEYQQFTVMYLGDDDVFTPRYAVTWVEGHGHLVHGQVEQWDVMLDDCVVVVDGVEYRSVDILFIPEEETPFVKVMGMTGELGNIRVWRGLHPHVNGTLEVEEFLHEKDGRTQMYESIWFRGEDIHIYHTEPPEILTDSDLFIPFRLEIEVTISPDTRVVIEEATQTPLWVEAILIASCIIMIFYATKIAGRLRSKD
jgi:hypothetical protein